VREPIDAPAKSLYDLPFKPAAERPPLDDGEPDLDERHGAGCWSYRRHNAWDVAIIGKDSAVKHGV
jgi:hypothetical protein